MKDPLRGTCSFDHDFCRFVQVASSFAFDGAPAWSPSRADKLFAEFGKSTQRFGHAGQGQGS